MNAKNNLIHVLLESIEESHILQLSQSPQSAIRIQSEKIINHHSVNYPAALFPGSFNPLHEGHQKLKTVAEEILGCPIEYEISIRNIDKPIQSYSQISEQFTQFSNDSLILTNAPTFLEKAKLFPGTVFIVGVDTAERINNTRFYGQNYENMLSSLRELKELDCSFLVAARRVKQNILELKDLSIPNSMGDLFQAISQNLFYYDISSTEIRDKK